MPDPNAPNEHTRKSPPRAQPDAPTGPWAAPADPAQPELAVPARVGRFVVKAVLGTGTYGRVLLALDEDMGRRVAIKQPFGEGLKPQYRADFLKEARAAAVIDQHANVCPVYHIDTENGLPYIVMRFVPGGTLKAIIERRGALPPREAAAVAAQIARGLAAAHAKGVIHRDLKPANVLFDPVNGTYLLTDFGLARITTGESSRRSGDAHGTPLYMPPEQWGSQHFGPITPLADVYSLGAILYELLTGAPPFVGNEYELMTRHCADAPRPPSHIRPQIDERIEALCLKALRKQPAERFRSAREFADELTAYLKGGLPIADEVPPPVPPVPPVAPNPPIGGASTRELPAATLASKEVVRCPKCESRLEIQQGRTQPVKCPMCEVTFAVEAGRRAEARPSEEVVLRGTQNTERRQLPASAPPPIGASAPAARKPAPARTEEREPRSRKLFGRLFALALLGAGGGAVAVYWDDIELWSRQFRPKPVEFQLLATVTPGADQARPLALVARAKDEPPLLLTNSERRDVLAVGWGATGRKAHVFRKPAGTDLDPERLRYRAGSAELVAFGRDPAEKAHATLWVYALRERDEPDEVTPRAVSLPRHVWDVNAERSRALTPPGDKSVGLLNLSGGGTQAALSAGGPAFRAVAFAPDGDRVVGLCDESQLRVWSASTGGEIGTPVRLAVRPDWGTGEVGELGFDPDLTRVTVTTDSRVGVYDARTGAVVQPMRPRTKGEPLRDKYRLRVESAGPGTFSAFHDDFRLRAGKLEVPEGGVVSASVASADGAYLAASVRRKVFLWRVTPAPSP
jgi:serine/threonine protein kinase